VAWYGPEGTRPPSTGGTRTGPVGGGIARAGRGPFEVWLRAGSRRWHGHADLLSCEIRTDDGWLIGDPGTGTYNGDLAVRNGLRSSAAHSVLRVAGHDQLEPHRAFRWRHRARSGLGHTYRSPTATILWGWHDAYRRLDPGVGIVRTVVVTADAVVVADWCGAGGGVVWDLTFPIGPEVTVSLASEDENTATLRSATGPTFRLTAPGALLAHRGSTEPWAGWWSRTYGDVEPGTWLTTGATTSGPIMWSLAAHGAAPPVVEDRDVRVPTVNGGLRLGVEWVGNLARLRVRQGEHQWIAAVTT
jgi:hypothetical protein